MIIYDRKSKSFVSQKQEKKSNSDIIGEILQGQKIPIEVSDDYITIDEKDLDVTKINQLKSKMQELG